MKDLVKNPFVQRVVLTVVAAILALVAVTIASGTQAEGFLFTLAGGLGGGAWLRRPGDSTPSKPQS